MKAKRARRSEELPVIDSTLAQLPAFPCSPHPRAHSDTHLCLGGGTLSRGSCPAPLRPVGGATARRGRWVTGPVTWRLLSLPGASRDPKHGAEVTAGLPTAIIPSRDFTGIFKGLGALWAWGAPSPSSPQGSELGCQAALVLCQDSECKEGPLHPSLCLSKGGVGLVPARGHCPALCPGPGRGSVPTEDPARSWHCVQAWEPETGVRCGLGARAGGWGQGWLLLGTSPGCSPPGPSARSVHVCFINPSHCNDS